jgi:hypothetical protein
MKRIGTMGVAAAALLAGACDVTVNNKSIDNQVDAAAERAGNLAEGAGEAIEQAGEAVGNQADRLGDKVDRLGNRVDINVDLDGKDEPAAGNKS